MDFGDMFHEYVIDPQPHLSVLWSRAGFIKLSDNLSPVFKDHNSAMDLTFNGDAPQLLQFSTALLLG